jgi:hypothetical protein
MEAGSAFRALYEWLEVDLSISDTVPHCKNPELLECFVRLRE